MNKQQLQNFINSNWDNTVIPALAEYIKIPNKSPAYDTNWAQHGYMDKAVELIYQWCQQRPLPQMKIEVMRLDKRTPLICIDIPGTAADAKTVLLYGHLDKQPEMTGWDADLGPWLPVIKNDRLYGRGGADDGYAVFSAYTAILALHEQNLSYPRCVILIEACEESGSYDLPFYIEHLQDRLGKPSLVICLDSGCANYEQLWCTTSLRGLIGGTLSIEVLTEGVHSGNAGGIVPSPILVLRQLLARIEDEKTGDILPSILNVDIPEQRRQQAKQMAEIVGKEIYSEFPFQTGMSPITTDLVELALNRTWRAALTVTGIEGIPNLGNAGNVLLPKIKVKLSLRVPPTCEAKLAAQHLKNLLEDNPPFNAKVSFTCDSASGGWNSLLLNDHLAGVLQQASLDYFNKPAAFMGEGGSIPFIGMLGKRFPEAQFMITGVLGPHSNAHGPNEFLHIPTAKKLTCCIAQVIHQA